MKEEGLFVKQRKRRKFNFYKGEITPAVENLIDRDFHAEKPNQKWLTDITEFSIKAGKVYLSPIIDCLDGMLVKWTIGTSPNAELVNTMLRDAISTLGPNEKPIVHSDRGCHYRGLNGLKSLNPLASPDQCRRKDALLTTRHAKVFSAILKQRCFTDVTGMSIPLRSS